MGDSTSAFRARTLRALASFFPKTADSAHVQSLEQACWERAVQAERVCSSAQPVTSIGADTTQRRDQILQAAYAQACRSAIANLSDDDRVTNGNGWLRDAVAHGKVDIDRVPTMAADELAPNAGHAAPRRCRASADAIASDAFECPCCSKRKCVHYELQTRSADEATTIFVSCVACGHRWTE